MFESFLLPTSQLNIKRFSSKGAGKSTEKNYCEDHSQFLWQTIHGAARATNFSIECVDASNSNEETSQSRDKRNGAIKEQATA